MSRLIFSLALVSVAWHVGQAAEPAAQDKQAEPADHTALSAQLASYIEAFNQHDAAAVAQGWSKDAISLDEETGEQTQGREALKQRFTEFFEDHPGARLIGEIVGLRLIRPDVATLEGKTT